MNCPRCKKLVNSYGKKHFCPKCELIFDEIDLEKHGENALGVEEKEILAELFTNNSIKW